MLVPTTTILLYHYFYHHLSSTLYEPPTLLNQLFQQTPHFGYPLDPERARVATYNSKARLFSLEEQNNMVLAVFKTNT
jgi:hypothetical protein